MQLLPIVSIVVYYKINRTLQCAEIIFKTISHLLQTNAADGIG
uniref:Uncharacterized protein n=1 Tax=Arundo donax TaxID=35708 RepID=A0A0A9LKI3_ARUDO